MIQDVDEIPHTDDAAPVVVGVGASAGGLEALEKLLDGTRADGVCAYVIVTHLSPDFKSLLDELLRRHTAMPVKVVEDGMSIEPDVVYVLPPSTEMIVASGRLHLADRKRDAAHALPINLFFESLAREYKSKAIGVILSGSGSDGAKGVEAIRANGGYVIAQDPESARFDGMPRAAITSGGKIYVTKAEKIGAAIAARAGGTELASENPDIVLEDTDERSQTLTQILQLIYGSSNVDFSLYKFTTVYRRIRRRMITRGYNTLGEYLDDLREDPVEVTALADDLLITVTEFFRDREAFDFLAEEIIPQLVAKAELSKPIRIWVAACSTGQEAYSIAMLIYMEGRKQGKRIEPQIYATDLREASIQQAGAGIYNYESIQKIPAEIREVCFERVDSDEYRIIQSVRRWIVFAQHNILRDPPFTRVDLISCRNALIYFEGEAQKRVLSLFNFGLRDRGFLFLGRSESLGELESDFEVVSQRWRLFRKTGGTAAARLSVGNRLAMLETGGSERIRFPTSTVPAPATRQRLGPAYAALIDAFIPEGALITANREVLHIFGDAGDMLRAPRGAMEPDILKMVPPGLRVPVAAALDRAASERREIVFPRITRSQGSDEEDISLRVMPLESTALSETKFFFVGFDRPTALNPLQHEPVTLLDSSTLESDRIISLERELEQTRENLQATIEEVETSNEELQSTNEELMAANEELQSTNEELQSVNEELYTVNGEYQKKNDDLEEVTRDIDNLIASTEIGVIFVDDKLIIRRFTTAVAEIFNIVPLDVGRGLQDLTHRLVGVDLCDIIRHVLRSRTMTALELPSNKDQWWQVRIIPLAAEKGRGDGAVITFYDVTALKTAQVEAEQRTTDLRIVAELTGARVIHHRVDGGFDAPQTGWTALCGQRDEASLGFGWIEATHADNRDRLRRFWRDARPVADTPLQTHMRIRSVGDDIFRHITLISTPDFDVSGAHKGWISVLIDVEDAIQSEMVVRRREQMLETVLQITPSRISYVDAEGRYRFVNQAYEDSFGVMREDIIGKPIEAILPAEMYAQAAPNIAKALSGESVEYSMRGFSPSGREEVLHVHYEPDVRENGYVVGFAVSVRDITTAIEQIDDGLREKAFIAHALTRSSLCLLTIREAGSEIGFASKHISKLTGYSAIALRQKTLSDLLPEYDESRLDALISRARKSDDQVVTRETFLINRAGDSLDIELQIMASGEAGSDPVVVTLADRTASRGAESALRRRTEELSRSNRMLEIFAGAATHELTGPLRRVGKFSSLLLEDYGPTLGEEGGEFLDIIVDETRRMRRTVDSVIELAGLERSTFEPMNVPLDDVLLRAKAELIDQIEETNAEILVEPLPVVKGEQVQLEILFRNLLMNAMSHRSPDRTPSIHVRVDPAHEGTEMTRILVSDNGRGIPQTRRNEVFLPFVRFEGQDGGIGMGLALCQRISETHSGSIAVTDTSPAGTTFALMLHT